VGESVDHITIAQNNNQLFAILNMAINLGVMRGRSFLDGVREYSVAEKNSGWWNYFLFLRVIFYLFIHSFIHLEFNKEPHTL
jgi:hypothetical protein